MPAKVVISTTPSQDSPSTYEDTHVHTIYDTIAHHFSSTRYKPWPVVAAFLASIPAGQIGLDAGCGNGKYLIAPKEREGIYWIIGLDRSTRLSEVAKRAGGQDRECVLGDVLDSPWRAGAFDFAISIATIHHLSTPERRKKSVQSFLKCLSPSHGRGLIYVWSIRQDELSKRSFPLEHADPNRKGQDVFVPWVLSEDGATRKAEKTPKSPSPFADTVHTANSDSGAGTVFNRYYHMFGEGELRELVIAAAIEMDIHLETHNFQESNSSSPGSLQRKKTYIEIVRDDWERSNYYVEFRLFQR